MGHRDRKFNDPFALQFGEKDPEFYTATPEQRRVVRAFGDLKTALRWMASGVGQTPRQATRTLYETLIVGENLLDFASHLYADWLMSPETARAERSLLLTLLVRAHIDEQGTRHIQESQISQMARVIAGVVPRLPVSEMRVLAQWAADMGRGLPDHFEAQPVVVMRGALFSRYVVKAFDAERAREFWTRAIEETDFPWNLFSAPCRPAHGSILTEFHAQTIVMILGIAPEPAVHRIVRQLVDHATQKRVPEPSLDGLGGKIIGEKLVPAEASERRQLFSLLATSVTDAYHPGRRSLVADLFGQATA